MKIINVDRGRGKTTRALFLSEYFEAPILCANERYKKMLLEVAKEHHIMIPKPITTHELHTWSLGNRDAESLIVDEMPFVLSELIQMITDGDIQVECATISAGNMI